MRGCKKKRKEKESKAIVFVFVLGRRERRPVVGLSAIRIRKETDRRTRQLIRVIKRCVA